MKLLPSDTEEDTQQRILIVKNLTLDLKYNDLVLVYGQSGTGKSTLLEGLLKETPLLSGTLDAKGTYAYVS